MAWMPVCDYLLLEARKVNPVTGLRFYSPREIQAKLALQHRIYVTVNWIVERTVWLDHRNYRVLPEYQGFDRICAWLDAIELLETEFGTGQPAESAQRFW